MYNIFRSWSRWKTDFDKLSSLFLISICQVCVMWYIHELEWVKINEDWSIYQERQLNEQNYSQGCRSQFNNTSRMLMGLPPFCNVSAMITKAHTIFYAILRKSASLMHHVRGSFNSFLKYMTMNDRYDCRILNHLLGVIVVLSAQLLFILNIMCNFEII